MTRAAWITGARGFLGGYLAKWLAQSGTRVAGIGHGGWPQAEASAAGVSHWINADIHATSLDVLHAECGPPDVVFHLAGGSAVGPSFENPLEDFERTVHTTVRLLDWVRLRCPAVRIVAVSSAAVYGAGHDGPLAETAGGTPYSPYGYHKSLMEGLCRSYGRNFGLRVAVVRVFSAYGAGLRKQLLWDICSRLRSPQRDLVLDGTGRERRDWIHGSDVARLLDLVSHVLPSPDVPFVNGATGTGSTVEEIAGRVLDAWGGGGTVRFSGRSRPGDPAILVANVTRLQGLGFVPGVAIHEGIRSYVEWFRATAGT